MAEAPTTTTGTFVWNEIGTTDIEAGRKFYTGLFGWKIKEMDMGPNGIYTMFHNGAKDLGGLYKINAQQAQMGVTPHWMTYIGVDDVDASAQRAGILGGRILVPPTDIPGVGRFSVISDPQGAHFAIFKGTQG